MLPRKWIEAYVQFLLRYRWPVLALSLAATLFFGYHLSSAKIQMNFLDIIPPGHPYTQLAHKHARMFGSANVLVVAVEVKDGDIFTVETLNKIDRLTIALIETPGFNPWQVLSIAHPKVRNVQITGRGVRGLPLYYPGPPQEPADAALCQKAVYTNEGIPAFSLSRANRGM